MGTTCVSWWTWPSRWSSLPPVEDGGPMARRTFDVIDVTEILVHWHAGRSLSEMSDSLGVDRKTIRKYVAPAIEAGIVPGSGPSRGEGEWQVLVREWFPELSDTRLRDEQGLGASVASFRRYVTANLPEEARRSQVTVWSPHPAEAGEQAQID